MSVETSLDCMAAFADTPDELLCGSYHEQDLTCLVSQVDLVVHGLKRQLTTDIQPVDILVRYGAHASWGDEVTIGLERWAMVADQAVRVVAERTWPAATNDEVVRAAHDHEAGRRTKMGFRSERPRIRQLAGMALASGYSLTVREFSASEFLGERSNDEVLELVRTDAYEGTDVIPGTTTRIEGESASVSVVDAAQHHIVFLGGLGRIRRAGSLSYVAPDLHVTDIPGTVTRISDRDRSPEPPTAAGIARVHHYAVHTRLQELMAITEALWHAQSVLDEGITLRPNGRMLKKPVTIEPA